MQRRGIQPFSAGSIPNYGWVSYFPAALLVKLPIGTLLLLLGALACRCGQRLTWQHGVFLLVPPLFFLGVKMQTSINIGVRYVLPVYPFVIILASSAGVYCTRRAWIATAACVACLLATVASSALVAPHYLAYFNAIAGGPLGGCSWLLDSNLDWGQDLKAVKPFMDRMGVKSVYLSYFGTAPPDYYGIHYQFLPSFSPKSRRWQSQRHCSRPGPDSFFPETNNTIQGWCGGVETRRIPSAQDLRQKWRSGVASRACTMV